MTINQSIIQSVVQLHM